MLTAPTALLSRALATCTPAADRRASNPALSAVLIEHAPTGARLTCTDSTTTISALLTVDPAPPRFSPVAVSADNLSAVVKVLSSPSTTLSTTKTHLQIQSGTATHRLVITDAADFPPVQHVTGTPTVIPAAALRRIVTEAAMSVSADDNRYGLNGLHVEHDGSNLRLVSTDGSRLTYSEAPAPALLIPPKMLLPERLMRRAANHPTEADWRITISGRAISLAAPDATFVGRLIEGEFPDYRQVIPSTHKRKVVIGAPAFAAALRNAKVMATDRNHLVRFSFEPDRLVLSAQSVEAGDMRAEAPIELSGAPMLTGFNLTFFSDILSVAAPKELTITLGEALDPCLVRVDDREDCLFVVMPMRLE